MLVLSEEWTNFKSGGEKLSGGESCQILQKGSLDPVPMLLGTLIIGTSSFVLFSITKSRGHALVTCLPHALNSKLTATRCPTLPMNCEEHMGF